MHSSPDPYNYHLDKVTIASARAPELYDVTAMIAEMEFYESIDKLAIHGYITIVDNGNIIESVDFQGTESISIRCSIPDGGSTNTFFRTFMVERIVRSVKGNDNVEAVTLSIVDYDTYWNSTIDLSKSYQGKITEIMSQIVSDSFQNKKKLLFGSKDINQPVKYIVPGITPFQALKRLTAKCTGPTGTPFYCFASLESNDLRFFDMKEMLELPNINKIPYTMNQSTSNVEEQDANAKSYHIMSMDVRNTEAMMNLIQNGDVGARYNFLNTAGGYTDTYKFDVATAFENLWNQSSQSSLAPVIDTVTSIGGEYLTEKEATSITTISTSNTYNDFANINEDLSEKFHRGKSVSKAIRNYINKSSVRISTPGRNFFPVEANMTIGNKIQILVLSNADITSAMSSVDLIDQKRSGSYLILQCKHSFRNNRYTTHLNLGKLGNQGGNTKAKTRIGYGLGQIDPSLAKAAGVNF